MPTVDIIMPSYNGAKFIAVAIESVIAQTFTDWRIILVDDGSFDNTDDVVQVFLKQLGSKLVYIKQANAGPSAARNNAIRHSKSEYVAMLDADDVWLPARLERSLQILRERPQAGLAYGMIAWIDEEGVITHTFSGNRRHAEGRIAPYIYMRAVDFPCVSITLRRRCLDDVGLFDESLRATEDRDLWFRIALKYEIAFIPEVIACYRASSNSATTNPDRMLNAQLSFIQKHFGAPGCGYVARRVALSNIYRQRAGALSDRNQSMDAIKSAVHALLLYPFEIRNLRTSASLILRFLSGRS